MANAILKGKVTAAGAFEGSARFEFQGEREIGIRRLFADAADSEKETLLRQLAGPQFTNASIKKMSSADANDLTKLYWVQCELSDPNFFPAAKKSIRIGIGSPTAIAAWSG